MTDETAKAILDLDDDNLQNVWDWVTGQMLDASHTRDFWADQRAMARLWLMRDEIATALKDGQALDDGCYEGYPANIEAHARIADILAKITAIAGESKDS